MFNDSPATVAKDRADFARTFLTQVATIYRPDTRKGNDGSPATNHKPTTPKVRCRVMTSDNGSEVEQGDQIVSTMAFMIRFPWGTDVRADDEFEVHGQRYVAIAPPDTGRTDALFVAISCVKDSESK